MAESLLRAGAVLCLLQFLSDTQNSQNDASNEGGNRESLVGLERFTDGSNQPIIAPPDQL
jgi:hypothetical protein